MKNKLLWMESPSLLLLIPNSLRAMFFMLSGGFFLLLGKTTELEGFLNSNFFIKFLGEVAKNNIEIIIGLLMLFLFYYLYEISKLILKISSMKFILNKEEMIIKINEDSIDKAKLSNIYDIEIEKPLFLSFFNYGNVLILSNEIKEDSLEREPEAIILKLSGIKNPEKVKKNLIKIIKKINEKQ